MAAHTHDDVDWAARLPAMRQADALEAEALTGVAARLMANLPDGSTVVDAGCGTGGMSAVLAAELAASTGGTLILIDGTPSLLAEAGKVAAAAGGSTVRIESVLADVAGGALRGLVPPADLIWASSVVHHLPDQQTGISGLAEGLRPNGLLAVAEGGLPTYCLPWELGIGQAGLELRLLAARNEWFRELRASMAGAVPMPYGWSAALAHAGLSETTSFSFLLDHPAPASAAARAWVVDHLAWLAEVAERVNEEDRETVRRLLDPADPAYVGARDDVFLLAARTVHCGYAR